MNSTMMEVQNEANILCPMCGIQFQPKMSNICEACMLSKTDITIGMTKEAIINFCRFCNRYMRPPWVACERDSKQLLAILLKKIKGLNRAKIINAGFIWTESHSKRIKVKVTIEKELNNKTKIEQTFVTEFIENYMQCDDCKKEFTPHTWGAVVQVRQHVNHKKTFYLIEQLILKHGAYDKVLKVSTVDDGINFYYKNTTHALRLIDFLNTILPVEVTNSKQLISHDESSNVFVYKYTFAVEIPKLCRNDLVLLPAKLAKELGGVSRLVLCHKVGQTYGLLDLNSFNNINMSSIQYKHYEKDMEMFPLERYRSEFEILDSNPCDKKNFHSQKSTLNKFAKKLYMYNLTRRDSWENVVIKGALGEVPCGQLAEGFDLRFINETGDLDLKEIKGVQDIVLVRRFRDRADRRRAFKLRRLEEQGVMIEEGERKKGGRKKKMKEEEADKDEQEFLDELEADAELRKNVNLYKNTELLTKNMKKQELDELLGDMEVCEMMDDLKITEEEQKKAEEQNKEENEGIDELIAKMDKVTIEKE